MAETVRVLDRVPASPEVPRSPLERDGVRSRLRLNRASGLLALDTIRPDPDQPRKVDTQSEDFRDLVASVKTHGVLQPITVRHVEVGDYFRIVAGERRYRAALAAGLAEIGAIVKDTDDTVTAVQQIEENLHRRNLTPLEEAAAIRRLMSATGETQDLVARRIHKSPTTCPAVLAIDARLTRGVPVALSGGAGRRAGVLPAENPAIIPGLKIVEHSKERGGKNRDWEVIKLHADDLLSPFEQDLLAGFEGFERVASLENGSSTLQPPDNPGVYAVVRTSADRPMFESTSSPVEHGFGQFQVGPDALATAWVEGAQILYIGQTGSGNSRQTLRIRIEQLTEAYSGTDDDHAGGRRLWYLPRPRDLRVAWRIIDEGDPAKEKARLVHRFESFFDKRPFANEIEPAVRKSPTAKFVSDDM